MQTERSLFRARDILSDIQVEQYRNVYCQCSVCEFDFVLAEFFWSGPTQTKRSLTRVCIVFEFSISDLPIYISYLFSFVDDVPVGVAQFHVACPGPHVPR